MKSLYIVIGDEVNKDFDFHGSILEFKDKFNLQHGTPNDIITWCSTRNLSCVLTWASEEAVREITNGLMA